jgi:hypothetical protein
MCTLYAVCCGLHNVVSSVIVLGAGTKFVGRRAQRALTSRTQGTRATVHAAQSYCGCHLACVWVSHDQMTDRLCEVLRARTRRRGDDARLDSQVGARKRCVAHIQPRTSNGICGEDLAPSRDFDNFELSTTIELSTELSLSDFDCVRCSTIRTVLSMLCAILCIHYVAGQRGMRRLMDERASE